MRRAALALGLAFALATPAAAQSDPLLDQARARLDEASKEADDSRRAALISQARAAFEEFLKQNPDHPMAAQANVEIARILALQAKAKLSRASRLEAADARALEIAKARPGFTQAMARYQEAIAALDARIKKLDEAKKEKESPLSGELKRSKAQAELDAVVLQYELAMTHVGDDERKQRAEALDKAAKAFDRLIGQYLDTRIGHLARVWSIQARYSMGTEEKAVAEMARFVSAHRPIREAADAIRLAGYFGIQHTFETNLPKDTPAQKFQRTEKAADEWLRAYPDARNTPEGIGARYRLALMKEQLALLEPNARYQGPKA